MSKMPNSSVALLLCIALVTAIFTFVSCAGTQTKTTSSKHPEVDKDPMCSECHDDKRTMDHDKKWGTKHEYTMNPQKPACMLCHGDIANCGGMCHSS
jgi:uncharacterized ion transporter superfamily protein YfcC